MPAMTADMRVGPRVPPPAAVYNWTVFYIGAHGGWAWTEKDGFFPSGFETVSLRADGAVGGVQGGFNWQTGPWELGVEAQSSWGEIRKGGIKVDPLDRVGRPLRRAGTTIENVGTIAGRLGYACDRGSATRKRLGARRASGFSS